MDSQRFKTESSSLNLLSAIQAQNSSPWVTNPVRSQIREIEKKRVKNSKDPNQVKKKKRKIQRFFTSSNQKRKGKSGIASPAKAQSQESKKRLQTFKQDSGNALASPPFTGNDCIIQNHVNLRPVRTVRSKTLTLTQKSFEKSKKTVQDPQRVRIQTNPYDSQRFRSKKHENWTVRTYNCKNADSHDSNGGNRVCSYDLCLEQQYKVFRPWILKFWARLYELGLGFVKHENGEREERRERDAWGLCWTGSFFLFM